MPYNPQKDAVVVSKPFGAIGFPIDSRSFFYDEANFVRRAFISTAEVLAYFDTPFKREGMFYVFVNSTGTLQPNGTILGGTRVAYWWKEGTADNQLIVVVAKGDKGDAFTFDDFTPEEIELLQQPAIDAAEIADIATNNANTATSNANTATNNANIATSEAIAAKNEALDAALVANSARGWQPKIGLESDGATREVQKLIGWVGGTGSTPIDYIGKYIGSTGFVNTKAEATNVKGDKGDKGDTGDIYIDIKSFGVVGDGVTDDYLAWQSALNSVPNYGGTIYAGSGINGNHFLCSNTLKIKSNTKIIGIGLREPRFLVSHNNAALELNGEGIVLENIYVDAAGALGIGGGNGNAIDIIGTDTFNTSWIEIKSIIATSKNVSLNIDASARTNQPSSIFVNNSSFFRSHTSGNSISVKNTRYVFLDNIGCYATSGAVYSDIFIDSFSNNLMFSKANVIGNIVFNGNNPNVSNINSGGDITINSTSGNYTGILTTGHFNLTNISANNLFSVNLLGSATLTDNGSENKQLAFVGHIIQQGTKSISPSAIIENNSTYHFKWGLDGNSGFIGSTNSTPVMIKTNSVNRIIIKEDGINVFADNSAAISAGLSVNTIYRTSDGVLKIVY